MKLRRGTRGPRLADSTTAQRALAGNLLRYRAPALPRRLVAADADIARIAEGPIRVIPDAPATQAALRVARVVPRLVLRVRCSGRKCKQRKCDGGGNYSDF